MLKKTITFTDFDGNQQTEDHYFNLSKAELIEMELSSVTAENPEAGFIERLTAVAESNNGRLIMDTFKSIIAQSYGIRSEDGKRFIKSDQISLEFSQTAAYSALFVELTTDAELSAKWINGLVPPDLAAQAHQAAQEKIQGRPQPQDHQRVKMTLKQLQEAQSQQNPTYQTPDTGYGPAYIARPPHESSSTN